MGKIIHDDYVVKRSVFSVINSRFGRVMLTSDSNTSNLFTFCVRMLTSCKILMFIEQEQENLVITIRKFVESALKWLDIIE